MNSMMIKAFKNKLKNNRFVFGPFMKTSDPAFVEVVGWSGMDFAILDMEHGPVGVESMQNNIRGAQIAGLLPIVRVAKNDEESIGKALDIGAAGIEIPQITNAEQTRKAIEFAKFYPKGERGVCRFVRAAHYSITDRKDYFLNANDTLVILHLEGTKAIENMEEIFAVEGIDIVFIGPYDLSQSLGVPGETTSPKVVDAMQKIITLAKMRGIVVGTFTDTPETMEMWIKAGVQYISYSVDVGIFSEACINLTNQFKSVCKQIEFSESK